MKDVMVKDDIKIEDLIYEIRGKYVMLDSDLARLYNCKNGAKSINLAVKRHINRFPERFMFQLTEKEVSYLRFQFVMNPISWTREMRFNYEENRLWKKDRNL